MCTVHTVHMNVKAACIKVQATAHFFLNPKRYYFLIILSNIDLRQIQIHQT